MKSMIFSEQRSQRQAINHEPISALPEECQEIARQVKAEGGKISFSTDK
jgi:hypothetical protein